MRIEKRLTQIPIDLPLPIIHVNDEPVDEEKIESVVDVKSTASQKLFTLDDDNDDATSRQSKQTVELEVWQDNSLVNFEREHNLPSNKSDIYHHLGLRKSALSASSLTKAMSASSARVENMILNGSPSVIANSFNYTSSRYDTDDDAIKVDNICVEGVVEFDVVDLASDIPSSTVMDGDKDLFPPLEFDAEMIQGRIDGSYTTCDEPSLSSMVQQRRRIAMAVVIGKVIKIL